ncbi:MAG TPA: hypothetical protein VFV75_16840 [Candidatus Polarisedimenticolaceae bacterium]|nr:hypothetical protein [Candidatus Polarisedimenticolaceae bacterium]
MSVRRYDRLFYGGMAIALALTVFAGFAATYYLPVVTGRPKVTLSGAPFTTLVHVHAALFTTWVVFFIVQTALVARRRVALHRRMGVTGAVLAGAMVVAGTILAVEAAGRGAAPPGMDPLAFLAIPIFDMVLFTTFMAAALVRRRDPEWHKRLMLMAYISITVAAVARLPGVIALGPPGFFGLTFVFVIVAGLYDLLTRRRVHAAYLWGGGLFLLSQPLRLMISRTGAWHALAEALTR